MTCRASAGPRPPGERLVVAANARLDRGQADGGAFSQAAQQVIGRLRVVDGARQGLKAEQADGLLVQLVHGGAAKLAGRLEDRGGGKAHWRGLMQPLEQQRQRNDRGMRRHDSGSKQVDGRCLNSQPGRAHQHAGLLVERAGEIEDRGAGAERLPPVLAGQVFSAAEEGEVGAVEGVGADGLDEGDLIADLVQLALRVFFVEQGKVGRGKRRLGENVLQLPAQPGLKLRRLRSCTQASLREQRVGQQSASQRDS